MKRDPALASLSRDHHQALRLAQQLRRATIATARGAREAFLAYWEPEGRGHFRLEEEVLLPAFAAHGDAYHPAVARTLCDHVRIRQRAASLARDLDPGVEVLHELGRDLADHVRHEERQLFVLIEQTLPSAELTALAVALELAEGGVSVDG